MKKITICFGCSGQNLLNRLNKPNGINTQPGTVLGDIFHSADRASAILQNITNLGLISSKQTSVTRAVPEVTIEIPGVSGLWHYIFFSILSFLYTPFYNF